MHGDDRSSKFSATSDKQEKHCLIAVKHDESNLDLDTDEDDNDQPPPPPPSYDSLFPSHDPNSSSSAEPGGKTFTHCMKPSGVSEAGPSSLPSKSKGCPKCLFNGCQLTATNLCCSCADKRPGPKSRLFETFVDGKGFVAEREKRWKGYCPNCRGAFPSPLILLITCIALDCISLGSILEPPKI